MPNEVLFRHLLLYVEIMIIVLVFCLCCSGIISTALTSDVTEEDIAQHIAGQAERSLFGEAGDPLLRAEVTGQYKRALSMTDSILNSLERRSLAWEHMDFNHATMLTRGTTIGISDPIVGMLNFSITLQLSGTTQSLLASRKRFEAARMVALSRVTDSDEEAEIAGLG